MTEASGPLAVALIAAVDRRLVQHAELSHAAALASVARRGAPFTPKQAATAHRILSRCAGELAAAGIELPPPPAQDTATAVAERTGTTPPQARIRSDGRIEVVAPVVYASLLKGIYGGKKETGNGMTRWSFPAAPAHAAAIIQACTGGQFSSKVAELAADYYERAAALEVLDESTPVPDFSTAGLLKPGVELWAHQRRAVEFAVRSNVVQLAVPMGGGKTLATIAAVNRLGIRTLAIVCPNKVRGVWRREVRKYSAVPWHIVDGTRPSKRAAQGFVSLGLADRLHEAEACLFDCQCNASVHAFVINYEAFASEPWNTWVPPKPIDLAIYDEVHRVKGDALRTKLRRWTISGALAQWVNFTRRRIGLTGTPIPQTPLDVYGTFRALDPGIFGGSFTLFKKRYAIPNPHLPQMTIGYRDVADLAEKFFSITYRPEVDLELPAVTDITHEFDLEPPARKIYDGIDKKLWADLSVFTGAQSAAAQWDDLQRELSAIMDGDWAPEGREEELRAELEAASEGRESEVTPANVMVRLLRLQQLTGGSVIDDDGVAVRVSTAKAKMLAEVLEDVGCTARTDDGQPEPVIVFCRFRSDLDAVREVAQRAKLRYAEVSGRRHDGLTRDAEMNPDADVVAVQIQSGGTGVDFTRARVGIWYSLGYSLSDYEQARKRLDRPGQTRPVVMVHLLARKTADIDVYAGLEARHSVIAGVLAAHGVKASAAGFRDSGRAPDNDRKVIGTGAVELPFEQLMKDEARRLGAPIERTT